MSTWDPTALPPGEGEIQLTIDGAIAHIVVSQPARRNAISPGMMVQLQDVIRRISEEDGLCAVILSGAGTAFCAGGDLTAVRAHLMAPGAGEWMCTYMTAMLDQLSQLPVVVIAAVEGVALGGGAELVTCADIVLAGENAQIGFVHASLGVVPGWGGGRRLIQRVGARTALRLLAFAHRLSAHDAMKVGLVDEVVDAGAALRRARQWVAPLSSMPPASVRASVAIARGADEGALFAALWGGEAHQAALSRVRAGRR